MAAIDKPKTKTDAAYQRLRIDIISGQLTPDRKLGIDYLRQTYALGASPLREALSRLCADGFVTAEGQRGFWVAPTSIEDLRDITRMRIMLETQALRESIENGDDAWEADVVAAHHRLHKLEPVLKKHFPEWEQRNGEFHDALISACQSPWLLRFRKTLFDQHKRYRCIAVHAMQETRDVAQEHTDIKDATLARNIEAACEATRKHILNTMMVDESLLSAKVNTETHRQSPLSFTG